MKDLSASRDNSTDNIAGSGAGSGGSIFTSSEL